ncbi:MAG: hypothetical protein K6A82_01905 [Prevotella sp.]|nr:hypothetical protein [Prevotella sp.]
MKAKRIIYVLLFCPFLTGCNLERTRVRRLATDYVAAHAQPGETYHWNKVAQMKNGVSYAGRHCEYAQVIFNVSQQNGQERQDTLYLLLSENCRRLLNVSRQCDERIMPYPRMTERAIKELVSRTIEQSLKEE